MLKKWQENVSKIQKIEKSQFISMIRKVFMEKWDLKSKYDKEETLETWNFMEGKRLSKYTSYK